MPRASAQPIELLVKAAKRVVDAPGEKAWNFGWCQPEYRASPSAAFESPDGPKTIELGARHELEEAVRLLSREPAIRARWDLEELWENVVGLVIAAADASDSQTHLANAIASLRTAETNLVVMALANIKAPDEPLVVADCVIGEVGNAFVESVRAVAGNRPECNLGILDMLSKRYPADHGPVVVAALWTGAQAKLAIERAEAQLRTVLDLALLLEPDPGVLGMYSLRGPTNRPGSRGTTVHRPALEIAMRALDSEAELSTQIVVIRPGNAHAQIGWFSADPLPISALLSDPARRNLVDRSARDSSPIPRRIRLASRWYAEAHWASDQVDAMLSLGIALDALIGSRGGLPGRAMRERFALLEEDSARRQERARRYSDIFSVRSAIAHGSTSSALEDSGFVRGVSRDVVWAALRMLSLDEAFSPGSDTEIDELFESLRWGTATWDDQ